MCALTNLRNERGGGGTRERENSPLEEYGRQKMCFFRCFILTAAEMFYILLWVYKVFPQWPHFHTEAQMEQTLSKITQIKIREKIKRIKRILLKM